MKSEVQSEIGRERIYLLVRRMEALLSQMSISWKGYPINVKGLCNEEHVYIKNLLSLSLSLSPLSIIECHRLPQVAIGKP